MLLNKINEGLTKDTIQRTIYGLGLILWTLLMWTSITQSPYSTSSLGVNYITLFVIPALLLFFQIIRNNRLLWGLIFGLLTTYIIAALYLVVSETIKRSGNHVKAIDWEVKDVLLLLITFGLLFFATWTIYKIKPLHE